MSQHQQVMGIARHGLMIAVFLLAVATSLPGQYLTEAFSTGASLPAGGITSYLSIAADFNQNGYADIAYFPFSTSFMVDLDPAVSGVGPYTQQAYFATGWNGNVSHGTATDVNGDGVLDLILNHAGAFSIHIGNGNGTFVPAAGFIPNILIGPASQWFVMADVNHDGLPDILTGMANKRRGMGRRGCEWWRPARG
jgi:hypothetical protein